MTSHAQDAAPFPGVHFTVWLLLLQLVASLPQGRYHFFFGFAALCDQHGFSANRRFGDDFLADIPRRKPLFYFFDLLRRDGEEADIAVWHRPELYGCHGG